jgi:hypothetical protein
MLAYRRRRTAIVLLLIVGWAVSAWVAPVFVSFARDRMHYGCLWEGPKGWWCPPDAIPFEILVATQAGLGAVFGLALLVVMVFVGHPRGKWGAVALLVLPLLPAGYALLSLALAAVSLTATRRSVVGRRRANRACHRMCHCGNAVRGDPAQATGSHRRSCGGLRRLACDSSGRAGPRLAYASQCRARRRGPSHGPDCRSASRALASSLMIAGCIVGAN